jgi:hypothetical protein
MLTAASSSFLCAGTRLVKAGVQSTKNARLFLTHRENSSCYWSWVNFVGILLGVENNSVQKQMLTRKGLSKATPVTCNGMAS